MASKIVAPRPGPHVETVGRDIALDGTVDALLSCASHSRNAGFGKDR